jgi:hypothetical protein
MTRPKLLAFAALLLACLTAGLYWQHRQLQRLRADHARLLADGAGQESLREEISRLRQSQADSAELERLRQSQSELLQLRAEVSRLRHQLKEAELARRIPPAKESQPISAPAEAPLSPVETYSASLRASLASRQTLVTGGWSTADGKRTLLLLEPVVGEGEMAGQVTIQARFAEMPEDVLAKVGLDGMKSDAKESTAQSILGPEQAAHLLAALENSPGVNVMSAPRVSTLDGRQAQIKTVNLRTFGPGEIHELGPVVDVVPYLSADGRSVDLTVIAQLKLESSRAR